MNNIITILRIITMVEAISYIALLAVAMPLKYYWGLPVAVQVCGLAHGLLFLAFLYALGHTYLLAKWTLSRTALLFAASFIPIVPFFLDRRLREWALDYAKRKND